jgi:FkbM family methyltransferase
LFFRTVSYVTSQGGYPRPTELLGEYCMNKTKLNTLVTGRFFSMITLTTRQKMFLARRLQQIILSGRGAVGLGPNTTAVRGSVRWQLDLREGIDFAIWLLGAFEPRTVACYRQLIKEGDTVLDVGANIGAHTLHLAAAAGKSGRVLAFEPTAFAFTKLGTNLRLNPQLAARVSALQIMLADVAGDLPPPVYASWPLKSSAGTVHPLHLGRLESCRGATVSTLDQVVRDFGLQRVDLVKLDIDGHETAMLRGATATLKSFRPTIVMELAPYVLEERGSSLAELLAILEALGYALQDVATGTALSSDPAMLEQLIPPGGGRNIVARALV